MKAFKPLRGPERLIRMGQWAVALLFAYFLVMISAAVLEDLPSLTREPDRGSFIDQTAVDAQKARMAPIQAAQEALDNALADKREAREMATNDYAKAKASFDNWRATRSSTELSDQNPEVIKRNHELDRLLALQQQLDGQLADLQKQRAQLQLQLAPITLAVSRLYGDADARYGEALRKAELQAFFIRLAFVGPLLLAALWLFRRYRKGNQWPFVWGFILFALFGFFVELVPYLPSFGGYIRYGVGVVLTYFGGRALLRWLQAYLERKKQEQAASQEERKESIHYEAALTSLARNQCPSCDRPLILQNGATPAFCMHCGLQLLSPCPSCGLRKNAFYHYCPDCGEPAETSKS
ncbi:zinc ribbon domain-containing protein [Dickeya dadantii]|uniref:zinc ribbon domain-containing protein n=1 Tax=Dickeya dadantii TaxID=204038 RepID=UPI001495492F|nr:zinc ribbon domain-containing protein [Dickeya dadantii]NPE52523.1 zinc ribbon domain-containing protein [Dickeya dadantii]